MNRRSFLGTMLAFPAIVRAESLMPVRRIILPNEAMRTNMALWTAYFDRKTKAWTRSPDGVIIPAHDTNLYGTIHNIRVLKTQAEFDELIRMTRPADIIDYG